MPARSTVWVIVAALSMLAAEGPASGGEAVKLKPLGSIYVDLEGKGLKEPEAVACSGAAIVVADTSNGRMLRFEQTEDGAGPTGEIVSPQVPFPIRVAFVAGGDILALDGRSHRIARLTQAGEFKGFLDPSVADGREVVPRSLAAGPDGEVFVLDVAGARILVVDPSGTVERMLRVPDDVGFLSDIAVDARGSVFAIDSVDKRVYVGGPGDEALRPLTDPMGDDMDFPTAIAVDGEGRLFLADSHGGGVVVLGRDGSFRGRQISMGWREGFARYPSGLCVNAPDRLYLAERGNSRVQMFQVR